MATSDWAEHTHRTLERSGHRASAPRSAVVSALADSGCGASARDLAERLDAGGHRVGLASVYRALELLEGLRLVQRVDVGDGAARYEPFFPDGEHHHHLVCDRCGNVSAFEDPELERAIERLAHRVEFEIDAHDVTLRGECPACHTAR
ncbi:MAG: Fur family transcriptional regulator [Thermoleophilaceae bacterium]